MNQNEYDIKYKDKEIIKKYKEVVMNLLPLNFPTLQKVELEQAVDYSIRNRLYNGNTQIYNNYKEKTVNIDMLNLCDYIIKRTPIMTAYGVMFKKHEEAPNPIANVITKFLNGRKAYKKEMFKYPKGSEMFEKYNLFQLLAKLDANSLYGAMGEKSCILYNLHVAPSITTQARSCTSAAGLQFEMFLANNNKFSSFNEVVTFINNIISEKDEREYNDNLILDNNISVEDCFGKVVLTCGFNYIPSEDDLDILWEMLNNLSQEDINRIYYKNNLYEFLENSSMAKALIVLLEGLESPYLDPNESPKEIEVELEEFQSLLMEYVYYHHQVMDRIDKYHNMIRNCTILTDEICVPSYSNICRITS